MFSSRPGATTPVAVRILTHVTAATVSPTYPLMLGLEGPIGCGKSFQVPNAIEESGFVVVRMAGCDLNGNGTADTASLFDGLWQRALDAAADDTNRHPVVVIDDFDLSPAGLFGTDLESPEARLLTSALIKMADDPNHSSLPSGLRIPIIVTGTDLSSLHEQLTRHGRMDLVHWTPSPAEIADSVMAQLAMSRIARSRGAVERMIANYPDAMPADFSGAIGRALGGSIYQFSAEHGLDFDELKSFLDQGAGVTIRHVETELRSLLTTRR